MTGDLSTPAPSEPGALPDWTDCSLGGMWGEGASALGCPVCGALVAKRREAIERHIEWHNRRGDVTE